jgi:heterotetrameric sarcosine oxidase gamma subunit
VSDPERIARGPIAQTAPIVRLEGWEVSGFRSDAALRITDATAMAKLAIRTPRESALATALGVPFGRARRDRDGPLYIGSGPDEWFAIDRPGAAPTLRKRLESLAGDSFASVIDLTSGRALMRITGESAAALFAKLCAIDLRDDVTPDGSAFRSSVAKVVTDVVREDLDSLRSYWLHCEWSSGQYLFDACMDAGAEFGIEQDGLRID